MSGEETEVVVSKIHDYLVTMGEKVLSGTVPLEDFIIYKVRHCQCSFRESFAHFPEYI